MTLNILDAYVPSEPSDQNILDIFAGEWSSSMPRQTGLTTTPGSAQLFEDGRIQWAKEVFGGFEGQSILELGPLEGGHSYMLQSMGAAKVVAIEANRRAFLKCLCVKEVLGLERVHFKLGDFVAYLKNPNNDNYDVVLASGILYHMQQPIEVLDLIASLTNKIFLWTHYYDEEQVRSNKEVQQRFGAKQTRKFDDFQYTSIEYQYGAALGWQGFCGGPKTTSQWLTRDTITGFLKKLGYNLQINFDHKNHPNGPALAICALK